MRLKLVLKGPERMMGAQLEKTLDHGSLVIGRSPAAGWILPDPERIVSKSHCRIDRDFSGFVLTDTSTNGVEINDEPVGFGMPRLLANGDVLKLGDVVIMVRVETPSVAATPPPAATIPPIPLDGPFGVAEPDLPVAAQPLDSPASAQPASAPLPGDEILDDWWKPEIAPNDALQTIPVDIFPEMATETIQRTAEPQDTLPSVSGNVVFLVESRADIDVMALARAVESAAQALTENERRRFHERLRDLLEGNGNRQV